jgi:hypothetical protein
VSKPKTHSVTFTVEEGSPAYELAESLGDFDSEGGLVANVHHFGGIFRAGVRVLTDLNHEIRESKAAAIAGESVIERGVIEWAVTQLRSDSREALESLAAGEKGVKIPMQLMELKLVNWVGKVTALGLKVVERLPA